jgi:hypothetical protein
MKVQEVKSDIVVLCCFEILLLITFNVNDGRSLTYVVSKGY